VTSNLEVGGGRDGEDERKGNTVAQGSVVPKGFELRDDAVVRFIPKKEGGYDAIRICSRLEVVAQVRNDGREWSRLVRFKDPDGRQHEVTIPMTAFAGDGARDGLTAYLLACRPTKRATLVKTTGWHGKVFVLPGRPAIGPKDAEPHILQDEPPDCALRQSGTLEQWQQHVGKFCCANSRLIFSVSIPFAAPLLHLLGEESAGFHLVGNSSLGKTTAIRVGASVVGSPNYVGQWRQTANALEATAAQHNDLPLYLDEIGQTDSRVVAESAYALAGGEGKRRMNRDATGRPTTRWRLLFLSSGELTLADKIKEDGRHRATAGQAVRVLDIPARAGAHGLFEDLHGSKDGAEFSTKLSAAAALYYGTPLMRFVQKLAQRPADLTVWVCKVRLAFREDMKLGVVDGQVHRAVNRFSLVAAAGELGIKLGVLPWEEGEAIAAAAQCFAAWLGMRGSTGPLEIERGIAQVRKFLEQYGDSRFTRLAGKADKVDPSRPTTNRAGYRRERSGQTEYLIFREMFADEVCIGFNASSIARELATRGFLIPEDQDHMADKVRIPGHKGTVRMFVISAAILEDAQ
jgi:putative DNA primase/helicase